VNAITGRTIITSPKVRVYIRCDGPLWRVDSVIDDLQIKVEVAPISYYLVPLLLKLNPPLGWPPNLDRIEGYMDAILLASGLAAQKYQERIDYEVGRNSGLIKGAWDTQAALARKDLLQFVSPNRVGLEMIVTARVGQWIEKYASNAYNRIQADHARVSRANPNVAMPPLPTRDQFIKHVFGKLDLRIFEAVWFQESIP
jgi:hypothetical protein